TRSSCSVGDLSAELEVTDLHQRMLDGDTVDGGSDGRYIVARVLVGDYTSQSIEIHKQRPQPTSHQHLLRIPIQIQKQRELPNMPRSIQITIQQPLILRHRQHSTIMTITH